MSPSETPVWRRFVVAVVRAVLGQAAVGVAAAPGLGLMSRPAAVLVGLGIAVVWTVVGWAVLRRRQRVRGWAAARRLSFWLPELGTALRSWVAGPLTAIGLGSLVVGIASLLLGEAVAESELSPAGTLVPPLFARVALLVLAFLLILVSSPWRAAPLAVSTLVCGLYAALAAWFLDGQVHLGTASLLWPQVLLCVVLLASTGVAQRLLPHRSADRPPPLA